MVVPQGGRYKIPNFLLYDLKEKFENIDLNTIKKHQKSEVKKTLHSGRQDFSRIREIAEGDINIFDSYLNFLTVVIGKYLEKSLIILKIAKDNYNIDGLTPAEITVILRDKIRVARIHQPNISLTLGDPKNSRYLSRVPFKGSYFYKLTKLGEDFISNYNFQVE